jgi:predicted nucleic acid-binding protein
VDTGYWLAIVNSGDHFHERARQHSLAARGRWITTDAVLFEVGNALARARWRHLAAALLFDVMQDPEIEVVHLTTALFLRTVDRYQARSDKEWGLTDCSSFVLMEERGIRAALAADHHFVQAGFRALLLEEA